MSEWLLVVDHMSSCRIILDIPLASGASSLITTNGRILSYDYATGRKDHSIISRRGS